MTTYPHEFYADRDKATRYSAETILGLVLKQIPPIKSAVDVGCGVGTWLSVLNCRHGVGDLDGYDGPWVDPNLLAISPECFQIAELSKEMPQVTRRYDLAISLEVAEHIPEDRAAEFVKLLTDLSDTVLFSAAIPGQGGTGHVNEQWPKYWAKLFRDNGYGCRDSIRLNIWRDEQIPFWYRQNVLVFEKTAPHMHPPSLVHPELFLAHAKPGVKGSIHKLREAVNEFVGKS